MFFNKNFKNICKSKNIVYILDESVENGKVGENLWRKATV